MVRALQTLAPLTMEVFASFIVDLMVAGSPITQIQGLAVIQKIPCCGLQVGASRIVVQAVCECT